MHVQRLMSVYSMVVLVFYCDSFPIALHMHMGSKQRRAADRKEKRTTIDVLQMCLAAWRQANANFGVSNLIVRCVQAVGEMYQWRRVYMQNAKRRRMKLKICRKSKRLMIKELYDALNTLVEEKSLTKSKINGT